MKTATTKKSIVVLLLGSCLVLHSHCLAQTPKAITADYDVTLDEKHVLLDVSAAAASLQHELWLGVDYVFPNDRSSSASHLWKLDQSGKRIADIEIGHPETWGASAKTKRPSIRGIALTARGPKIYVSYGYLSQFWVLQLDEAGKLLNAEKIISRSGEASGGINFSSDMSEAVIIEDAVQISHLTRDGRLDWSVQIPIKEDEAFIHDAIVCDQIFVSAFKQKSESEEPETQVFSYDRSGKLLQKASLPGLNTGLSFTSGMLQLFQMSASHDNVAVVLLDPKSLHIQRLSAVPDVGNFLALLKAGGGETALLVSKKKEAKIGVLVLDDGQRQKAYQSLDFDFTTGSLLTTFLGQKIFVADNSRVFILALPRIFGSVHVISFSLPTS